jgi:anti-sigma B factor antagonist
MTTSALFNTTPDELSVNVQTVTSTIATITITGRLDAARCVEVRSTVDQMLTPTCQRLVIDLSEVTFVDSVGLAALVKAMRDAQKVEAQFVVRRPASDDAMRVFRLSKFDEVFGIDGAT